MAVPKDEGLLLPIDSKDQATPKKLLAALVSTQENTRLMGCGFVFLVQRWDRYSNAAP